MRAAVSHRQARAGRPASAAAASLLFARTGSLEHTLPDGFIDIGSAAADLPELLQPEELETWLAGTVEAHGPAVRVDSTRDGAMRGARATLAPAAAVFPHPVCLIPLAAQTVAATFGGVRQEAEAPGVGAFGEVVARVRAAVTAVAAASGATTVPLSSFPVDGGRGRSLLFKYLADCFNLPCVLRRSVDEGEDGSTVRYWTLLRHDTSYHVVDLLHRPGSLYPVTSPAADAYRRSLPSPDSLLTYSAGVAGAASSTASITNSVIDAGDGVQRWLEPPNLADKLNMIAKLGAGTYGEVHRASLAGFTVAVKVLHTGQMSVRDLHRVHVEMGLLREMHHPNVVAYLGRELLKNDDLRIIMEYVPHSLYESVKRARAGLRRHPPEDEVRHVTREVARGLSYLHQLTPPVLHRDLKSKNVLVEWDERTGTERITTVKLCDFGVAKVMSESTRADTMVGTTRWMAPEVVAMLYARPSERTGSDGYGWPADMWSLGMVVYEMAELRLPYEEIQQFDVRDKILAGDLPVMPRCDRRAKAGGASNTVVDVMLSCLRKDPTTRPSARTVLTFLT
jgi:hypothetical protein